MKDKNPLVALVWLLLFACGKEPAPADRLPFDPAESQESISGSPFSVQELSGPTAVVFHNLCTVFVSKAPDNPHWLLRYDSSSERNGGYTLIARDPNGVDCLVSDQNMAYKHGLLVEGVFVKGESFTLTADQQIELVESQEGFDLIEQRAPEEQ